MTHAPAMIPVCAPLVGEREKAYVRRAVDSGWISSEGPMVREFEERFAAWIGVKHGVAVCNGTAALETAMFAAGLQGPGEIIMPSMTIISCAVAALRLGLTPVLVDCEDRTWNMDVAQVEVRITPRTKAILAVHIYGHPVDMDPLLDLGRRRGIPVLEDAAEVHGARYKGRAAGSLGLASAFSFYANKIITTGEGGMVCTDDARVAERARSFRNLCFLPERRFVHEDLGYNFRMTALQAAVGLAQTEEADQRVALKRRIAARYRANLAGCAGLRLQDILPWAEPVHWMVAAVLDPGRGLEATAAMAALRERGVDTRSFFMGLHAQPVLARLGLFRGEAYPVTDKVWRYGLYLPSGLGLTDEEVDTVSARVREVVGG